MTNFLIHFTKGEDLEGAYQNLMSIVDQSVIYGSNTKIRDGSNCVCFSEAPLSNLKNGLLNPSFYSPYSPFGILVNKEDVYSLGGRPVIYQSESEFHQLSCDNSWRHMRYEPPTVEFTWEREWRLRTDRFDFNPSGAQIIVADDSWTKRMIGEHDIEQRWQTYQYSQIMDEMLAAQYEEPFPWIVIELNHE